MNMLLKTISCPILGASRSFLSSLSSYKYNLDRYTNKPHSTRTGKSQFSLPQDCHRLSYNCNKLGLPKCRTIYTSSSIFQNEIITSLEPRSETSERVWSFASKITLFEENENEFNHGVLKRLSAYSGTIYKDDPRFLEIYKLSDIEYKSIVETKNWDSKSPYEIITSFISLGVYASKKPNLTIEDQQFEALISAFVKTLSSTTEDQLIDCFISLKYWPLLASSKDPQIFKVWKELDQVCFKRYLDWSIDKCLFMMDLWYHMRLQKRSFFVYKGLNKISRKTDEFTAAQLIQSLFYMGCTRNINPNIPIREYEYHIQNHITKLSIEEIGIFALAFFKIKMAILNKKILIYMMQRTIEEVETIHSMTLASIAKTVRFSHKPDIGFTANDFVAKVMERRGNSLTLVTNIHLVHIGTQIQFYNEEILTKLAEQFCKNPSEARMKDMERIVFFLSLFNFIPPSTPDICHLMVEQLNTPLREKESEAHPLFFLSFIYFLSLLQVFPEKQIRQVLNTERLFGKYENKFNIPQQAVQLDYNRVLEGPAGSEHLLPPELREYVARRYSVYFPEEGRPKKSQFDQLMWQVMGLTNDLLGKENNLVTYTLPHFPRADILFHLDDNGNPLPIPEEMKATSYFEDVHRPIGSGKWYCVVIGGRNMYMHNVPRLVGEQSAKIRQLKQLGYTPIVIPSYYWKKEEDKIAYLKLKYFSDHEQNKR